MGIMATLTSEDRQQEITIRRARRNAAIGWALVGFVVLVFAITVVKMSDGHMMEGFDHQVRPSLLDADE